MNRYDFYPGDYLRDTLTLTLAQDGAYRRLLDFYYSTERPIADEQEAFAAARCRSEEDEKITQWVLHRFFEITPDGFRHTKADREIEKARPKIAAARANGSRGGRPKKQLDKPTGFDVGLPTETQSVTHEQTQTEPTRNPGRKLPSPSQINTTHNARASVGWVSHEDSMAMPVGERANLVTRDPFVAHSLRPHEWPEVLELATRFGRAMGCAPRLGEYSRDSGTRQIVAALGMFSKQELDSAVTGASKDPGFFRGKGFATLSFEVIRRAIGSANQANSAQEQVVTP